MSWVLLKRIKIIITGVYFSLSTGLYGQVPVSVKNEINIDDQFIRWIASVTSEDTKKDIGFFERIFNLIVGYDPVVFNNPVNVYAKGLQNYWIINQGEGTILHYLDGRTEKAPAFKKGGKTLPSMVGICQFRSEGMLFSDSRLNKIYFLSDDGKQFRPFNDTNLLARPTGIAYSEISDEIWVVETGAHHIAVLNRLGERKKIIGRRGNGPLEFNFPTHIWIDSSGRIYIVDSMNFRVQVLSDKGEFVTSFGKQGDATGYFARPRGIATDSQGNIYVVDALFNVVQIFDISGKLLYYFGSQGNGKYQFWMPSGIFIDKNDFIYVSDSYNGRVQIFQLVKNNQK
jgi:sugar lactone lactonase YvrE